MPVTSEERHDDVLDSVYGSDHSSRFPPTLYYAAYHAGDVECTYPGYARVAVANTDTEFPPADGHKTNGTQVDFPTPSDDDDDIEGWAIHGHATNDDVINGGDLGAPIAVADGQPIYIPQETLSIRFTPVES